MNTELESVWKSFDADRDEAAFERLYEAARPLVAAMAWKAVRDVEWTEEVVQALFARLWMNKERRPADGMTARQAFIRWTLDEARTANRRRWRQRDREHALENAAMIADSNPSPGQAAEQRLLAERLRELVQSLPEKYREPVLACDIEGLSPEEASAVLDRPANTVRTQIRRGREMLQRKLRKAGITVPISAGLAALAGYEPAVAFVPAPQITAQSTSILSSAGPIVTAAAGTKSAIVAGSIAALLLVVLTVGGLAVMSRNDVASTADAGAANIMGNEAALVEADQIAEKKSAETNGKEDGDNSELAVAEEEQTEVAMVNAAQNATPVVENTVPEAETKEEPEPNFLIYGKVVDANSKAPINGAMMSVFDQDSTGLSPLGLVQLPDPNFTGRTDEEGNYRLHIYTESMLNNSGMLLSAEADGFATAMSLLFPMPSDKPDERKVDFTLTEAGFISGVVVNEQDQPVSGVMVGHIFVGKPDFTTIAESGALTANSAHTFSNEDGKFTLNKLPLWGKFELPVIKDGYARIMTEEIGVSTADVKIVLKNGDASINGIVTKGGKPQSNVDVGLMNFDVQGSGDITRQLTMSQQSVTDGQGRFAFDNLVPGKYQVNARQLTAGTEVLGIASEEVQLDRGDNREIELVFADDVVIEGTIVNEETDEPVKGVAISTQPYYRDGIDGRLFDYEVPEREEVITGPDGKFEIGLAVASGLYSVFYFRLPDGYLPPENAFGRYEYRMQNLQPGGRHPLTLKLQRSSRIDGIVVDEEGNPLAGVVVIQQGGISGGSATSDSDGLFELFAPAGKSVTLIAKTDALAAAKHFNMPDDGTSLHTELIMQTTGSVAGTVFGKDGKAAGQMQVSAIIITEEGRSLNWSDIGFSDKQGKYHLENIPPGKVTIKASRISSNDVVVSRELMLAAGERREGFDLHLGGGLVIEGVVTDTDLEPIERASVYLQFKEGPTMQSRNAKTDDKGYYRIDGLAVEEFEWISFSHEKYISESKQEITVADSPLNVSLKPKVHATVEVVDQFGVPVDDFLYRLTHDRYLDLSPIKMAKVFNTAGILKLEKLNDLQYRLEVAGLDSRGNPDGRRGLLTFKVEENPASPLKLVIGGTYSVHGKVTLHGSRQPVEGARITTIRPFEHTGEIYHEAFDRSFVLSAADGSFTLRNLPPGLHRLKVEKDGYYVAVPGNAVIEADGSSEVVIVQMKEREESAE